MKTFSDFSNHTAHESTQYDTKAGTCGYDLPDGIRCVSIEVYRQDVSTHRLAHTVSRHHCMAYSWTSHSLILCNARNYQTLFNLHIISVQLICLLSFCRKIGQKFFKNKSTENIYYNYPNSTAKTQNEP